MVPVYRNYTTQFATIILVILAAVVSCTAIHIRHLLTGQDRMEEAFSVSLTLEGALSSMKDAESSVRAFALSGDERLLGFYKLSVKRSREEFEKARAMSLGDPERERRIAALGPIVEKRIGLLERLAALRKDGGLEAAAEEVQTNAGTEAMAILRHAVAELEMAERTLLNYRHSERQQEVRVVIAITTAGIAASLALACFALSMISREMNLRKKAEQASEEARMELEDRVASRTEALRSAEEIAREAQKHAESASAAKSDFLARVSHELRTPLNSILGFGQLLEIGQPLPPAHQSSVHYILRAGHHLLELVDELLDINAADSGRIALSLEPVPLQEIILECLEMMRPQADAAGVELTVSHDAMGADHIQADRQRLRQVLLNLLSNAVKFNRSHGKVCVACQMSDNDRIRIKIIDTGYGIPPADMERLCSPFERLGQSHSDTEGEGLGLLLARKLTEAMGGALGASSIVDQGSTFWIDLPRAESPVSKVATSDSLKIAGSFDDAKTILYVEDNLSNLKLIEHVCQHRPSISLIPAMQGRLALDIARERAPDLILLDLHLPDIDGEEVLRLLRSESQTRDIPVVILSAEATPSTMRRLLKAGARAYLSKPLNVAEFLTTLETTLTDGSALPDKS